MKEFHFFTIIYQDRPFFWLPQSGVWTCSLRGSFKACQDILEWTYWQTQIKRKGNNLRMNHKYAQTKMNGGIKKSLTPSQRASCHNPLPSHNI